MKTHWEYSEWDSENEVLLANMMWQRYDSLWGPWEPIPKGEPQVDGVLGGTLSSTWGRLLTRGHWCLPLCMYSSMHLWHLSLSPNNMVQWSLSLSKTIWCNISLSFSQECFSSYWYRNLVALALQQWKHLWKGFTLSPRLFPKARDD